MCANILISVFSPKISCQQVSSDGYEITNLISSDASIRRRGFLAESFLKPPVTVLISCFCPIELSHIVINGRVGHQRSIGFEIQSQISGTHQDDTFYRIGRVLLEKEHESAVFMNRLFRSRFSFGDRLSNAENSGKTSQLSHHLNKAISCVSKIRIIITRTLNSGVPAIGKLELWGQPSRGCPVDLVKKFEEICSDLCGISRQRPLTAPRYLKRSNEDDGEQKTAELKEDNHCQIPNEFIDVISCEIMTLPVLLPSGHSVDQTTLDKYLKNEASWGRSPNDPFTGISFTSTNKPVANPTLKARIDKFLLQHPEATKGVGRPVGKKFKAANRKDDEIDNVVVIQEINEDKPILNHQDELNQSLNSSLKNVLSSLKSFTSTNTSASMEDHNQLVCSHESHHVYKLPCLHLLCRDCVLHKKEENLLTCNRCKANFNLNQIVRIHL